MTQTDAILSALRAGERLTALEILRRGWGMRAAGRVNDIRNMGYDVRTDMVRRGDAMVAEYWLPREGELF